jgi:hypothetical protein
LLNSAGRQCGDAVLPASVERGQQEPKIKPMGQHFVACAVFPVPRSHCGERLVHLETKDLEQIHDFSAVLNLRGSPKQLQQN